MLETRLIPLPAREVSPSMLLAAPFAVVPWHSAGRAEIMATLDAWADDATQPVDVRLLHAPGGAGKTRLAMEWLRRRRDRGDTAGFLPAAAKDDWLMRACGLGAPVVAVIDYAETRADLLAILGAVAAMAAAFKPPRVRALLLARSDGDWWDALLEHDLALKVLLTAQPPIALHPLAMGAVERQAVFGEALVAFARHRGRLVPRTQIAMDDPRFDRVLYVHMAALAAVERAVESASAGGAVNTVVLHASGLMDETLDHEQRFWLRDRQGRNRGEISLAQQIVAAATLRGGIARKTEARQLCRRLSDRDPTEADDDLLALLHDVYAVNKAGSYLSGLQPDLLGEAMVLRVASKQTDEKWIERVIVEGDNAETVGNAFMVLGRAAVVDAVAVSPWLATLLQTELAMRALPALRATKVVGQRTAFAPLGDLLADALEQAGTAVMALTLSSEPIPFSTVSLRRVAEWRSRVQLADPATGDEQGTFARQAALMADWGIRLIHLGQRERALATTQEAAAHFRALAVATSDAFAPDLAHSLNDLGAILSELGQPERALAVTEEAVHNYHALAATSPNAYTADLAKGLNNLGNILSALGQRERALAATQEAVHHLRALAASYPDTFTSDLAKSLNNLGNMLSALGQRERSLAVTQEAVEIRRVLAAVAPDAFVPDLATSLNNLGLMLSALNQHERALIATQEAVDLFRALAMTNPKAFAPGLAMSLNNLGKMLSALGQHKHALAATQEAVDHYRALAATTPDAFIPDLATSLNNLGLMLNALNQHERALIATQEAVDHFHTLAIKKPRGVCPNLATSLNNLGKMLSVLGQRKRALAATQEAVDHFRTLAATNPEAFAPNLARTLNDLGAMLSAQGQRERALAAIREAVDHLRVLAANTPDVFASDLARSLKNLGAMLNALGQREAAIEAVQESVNRLRLFATNNPDAFAADLAGGLHNLGNMLSALGQCERALATTQEAVGLYRALAIKRPDIFLSELAMSLDHLALQLIFQSLKTGNYDAVNAMSSEAAEIRRTLQAKPRPGSEGSSA